MSKYENLTCLIVDDYSTARSIIKKTLNELGFSCKEASNGEQAMATILQTSLDLIIADTNMPKKNGFDLLEEIRGDENIREIPVILTMIEPLEDLIEMGKNIGMSGYVVKPFDVFTISKILDKVIKTEGGEAL